MKTKRLFSPKLETLNIGMGLLVLGLAVSEIFLNIGITQEADQTAKFITSSLFLNSIHIYFTFGMLLFLPHLNEWRKSRREKAGSRTWIIPLAIFALITALYVLNSNSLGNWKVTALLFAILITVIPAHHVYSQMRGLSYLYYTDKKSWQFAAERKLSVIFTISIVLWTSTGVYHFLPALWTFGVLCVVLVCSGISIWLSFSIRKELGWNKFLYSLRFLLFSLGPLTKTAIYGLAVLHGVEYYCVYKQMSGNSPLESERKKILSWSVLAMCLVGIVLLACRQGDGAWKLLWHSYHDAPLGVKILGGVLWGLTFMHYYFDRLLFRMRSQESRAYILPLMVGPSLNPEPKVERLRA